MKKEKISIWSISLFSLLFYKILDYDGIIYKSTVSNNRYGTDIVLFDKMLAKPFCEIRFVDYKNKDIN